MSAPSIPTGRCYAVLLYDWETEKRYVLSEPWLCSLDADETDVILRFSGLDPADRDKKRQAAR